MFSMTDLICDCHQVLFTHWTPAVIPPFGLCKFLWLPFNLKNTAQTFQHLVDTVLKDLPFLFVYLVNILNASSSSAKHRHFGI